GSEIELLDRALPGSPRPEQSNAKRRLMRALNEVAKGVREMLMPKGVIRQIGHFFVQNSWHVPVAQSSRILTHFLPPKQGRPERKSIAVQCATKVSANFSAPFLVEFAAA